MIIIRIWEGLGNQLFQYAYARSLQVHGHKVYLDSDCATRASVLQCKREYKLNNYNITVKEASEKQKKKYSYVYRKNSIDIMIDMLQKNGLWKYQWIEQKSPFEYDEKKVFLYGNYYVKGWFQNPKHFEKIREILLKELTPKKKICINTSLKNLISNQNIVAVHIRRGDYVRCHVCMSMEYYHRAMNYFKNNIDMPLFLFFSDDMEWVHEYFGENDNFFYIDDFGKYEDYEELLIMSRCKNIIMANSTFSWWAAWLNKNKNKMIIAPERWNKSVSREETNMLIPKEWIRI